METLIRDIRYGLRMLRKSPVLTLVAALSLALGIGANSAIFTVVNAIFLHPLPVLEPERLVNVFTTDQRNRGGFNDFLPTSYPNYEDYRDHNQVFSALAADQGIPLSLSSGGEPQQVGGQIVTGNYFDILGVHPRLGRGFLPEEDRTPGTHPVAVLSDGLWRQRFGADPQIVGKVLALNGQSYAVIGVMPPGFKGTVVLGGPDVWVPMMMHDQVLAGFFKQNFTERRFLGFNVFGRLKPGVTVQRAQAELRTIASQLEKEYPIPNKDRSVTLIPLLESAINPALRSLFVRAGAMMMAVVGMVLLIACANVANLLLARSSARRREISIRIALGASRKRLVTQLMTESFMLALIGGVLGMVFAVWGRNLLWAHRPPFLNGFNTLDLPLDGRVLGFTLGVSLLTGLVFGVAPALQSTNPELATELKERAGSATGAQRRFNLRNLLLVAEVVLSLVAVIGAGLFVLSLRNAQRIDTGLDEAHLAVLTFDMGAQGYTEARGRDFYQQVQEKVQALPGVRAATVASGLPFVDGGFGRSVFPEGQEQDPKRRGVLAQIDSIAPGYFQTVGLPLVSGRDFNDSDRETSPKVVIVNQTFAHRFWPDQNAVGKRFKFFGDKDYTEVVGIARDGKYNTLGEDPLQYAYLPLRQAYSPTLTLFVRSQAAPQSIVATVRAEVQGMDRQMPLTNVLTFQEVVGQALWTARMSTALLGIFAALALLLAMVGIYGVMAYSVSQRTREIGIRMALGARPIDVLALVFRQGMSVVVVGLVVGLVAAFAVMRLVSGLLYGVSATDPTAFLVTAGLLTVAAAAANYIPARRATKVDPMVALRYE
jgi:predicted permease